MIKLENVTKAYKGTTVALRDLKGPLALDDTFPMTLHFAKAGKITVTAIVEAGSEDDSSG